MFLRRLFAVLVLAASLAPFAHAQEDVPVAPPPLDIRPRPAPVPPPPAVVETPTGAARAIGTAVKGAIDKDVAKLRSGPLLIHGNYCGIGNRPGTAPVDVLDAACKQHDACTHTGSMPSCRCDERFGREASAIANDPSRTDELRALAASMAASMAVLICK